MTILAPIAAMLIQMAISRSREYLADDTGAELAGALEKLGAWSGRIPMKHGDQATAHLFISSGSNTPKLASAFWLV